MSLPRPRHIVLLLLLACLSIAGAALSGCGAADKVASAADPVDEAIAATTKAQGAKFQIRMAFEGQGLPGTAAITADGVADLGGSKAQLTMDLGSLAALAGGSGAPSSGDMTMEIRLVDGTVYLRGGLLSKALPAGKSWIGIDMSQIGRQLGIDPSQLSQISDPTKVLDYLKDAGDVTEAGHDTIRGVPTTRYRAHIKIDKALDALGAGSKAGSAHMRDAIKALLPEDGLPAEVWIDEDHLLRRMEMKVTTATGTSQVTGAGGFGVSVRLDLFDYGTKVSVSAPPSADVADGSKLFGAGTTP